MAVCLDYQAVYGRRNLALISWWAQIMAAVLLLLTLALKIWIKIESVDLGYQLAKERQYTIEYDMQRRELELQKSVLLRSDNLTKVAAKKLGMRPLDMEQARKLVY